MRALTNRWTHRHTGPILYPRPLTREGMKTILYPQPLTWEGMSKLSNQKSLKDRYDRPLNKFSWDPSTCFLPKSSHLRWSMSFATLFLRSAEMCSQLKIWKSTYNLVNNLFFMCEEIGIFRKVNTKLGRIEMASTVCNSRHSSLCFSVYEMSTDRNLVRSLRHISVVFSGYNWNDFVNTVEFP